MHRALPFAVGVTMITTTGALAAPADRIDAEASLVHCAAQTCLRVTGHRDAAGAPVSLAGHAVDVAGGRRWQAIVPLAALRLWSPPSARTISIAVGGGTERSEGSAALPIGVLGDRTELALLDVRASRVERHAGAR